MIEKELLRKYLDEQQPFDFDFGQRTSTLIAALRDSRQVTKRNLSTGDFEIDRPGDIGNWLGAIGYMTILDQIGTSLTLKGVDKLNGRSPILRALTFFYGHLNELQIHALIALRNAFSHDFNLINIATGKFKNEQTHRFTVYALPDNQIVTLPAKRWDGNFESKSWDQDTETKINLFEFGNVVESVVKKVRKKVDSDEVELNEVNLKAYLNKYTFKTFRG
jgi:hypothetical protein